MSKKNFHGNGAQLVKDASHPNAIIGMGIASILGRHQRPIGLRTGRVQFRSVVMAITQDETDFSGDFTQQSRSKFAIGNIGGVNTAAMENQTVETKETTCSFKP
jgi:hypothetical protein